MRPSLGLSLVLCACAVLAMGEEQRTPLLAIEYDMVRFADGSTVLGLVEEETADGVRLLIQGKDKAVLYPSAAVREIQRRRTLAESVTARGREALAAADFADLNRIVRVVDGKLAEQADAPLRDAAIAVLRSAVERRGSTELAAPLARWLLARQDLDGAVAAAKAGLAVDGTWSYGWEVLAQVQQQRDATGYTELLRRWLDRLPASATANRLFATEAETRGDLRGAAEARRKGFDLHHDDDAGLAYARLALRRGDAAEAKRVATALVALGRHVASARCVLAALALAKGEDAQAATLLDAALSDPALAAEDVDTARYHRGLVAWRAGRRGEALGHWRQVKQGDAAQAAALGIAMATGARSRLAAEAPAALRQRAATHDAGVAVLAGTVEVAALGRASGDVGAFLIKAAEVVRSQGAAAAVAALPSQGVVALRWQAYGHLLGGRMDAAEAILDRLSAADGWVLSCRVYLAVMRKDDVGARAWFQRLGTASEAPEAYVARLASELASANDEVITEAFDWPEPDVPSVGWIRHGDGSGLRTSATGGTLRFTGVQTGDGMTRLWRLVPSDRLRGVSATLTAGAGTGLSIELADEEHRQGIAVGVRDGKLRWRPMVDGRWGPWSELAGPANAVRLACDRGRITVLAGEQRHALPLLVRADGTMAVGLTCDAEAGTSVSASVDTLEIQLRPVARR